MHLPITPETTRSAFRRASLYLGTAALAGLLSALQPAAANPFFQDQTHLQCSACHQPGREKDGEAGLNPFGMAFMDCGDKQPNADLSCPGGPPLTNRKKSASAADGTTRTQAGMAKFEDSCDSGDYYIIRIGGSPSNAVRFMLKNGHKVHIEVPVDSTYASQCGGFAGADGQYEYINLE